LADCRLQIAPARGAASSILLLALVLLLAACGEPGPPPTPTSALDPLNHAVATAEAAGDSGAQAAALYERGNLRFDQGELEEAIADYSAAVALDPAHSRAFHNRAFARATLGDAAAALADYDEAIRLDPAYVRAHQNRLRLLEQQAAGAADPAPLLAQIAAGTRRRAALEPAAAALYRYQEGAALVRLRDAAGARAAFDAALLADPQQVDALYERGLLSFAEGRLDAALADFDAALALSPRAANAHYARGLARQAAGDLERAIADFSRAIALRPAGYPEALLARAVAYVAAGQGPQARADLERLEGLQLDETLTRAADALRAQLP
jgi:tetratricopeptide (TPR) repeat protein